MKLTLFLPPMFLLVGCASLPLAVPQTPGTGVIAVTTTPAGFVVTGAKHDYLLRSGVPATWFTAQGADYWISEENEGYAADVMLKDRNL